MMGATVKNHYAKLAGIDKKHLYVVSIVPCIAKKYEAARPEFAPDGIRDVDAVLTTDEMLEMVDLTRMDVSEIVPQEFDVPYKRVSGAGVLFGASGGVAEAALRMAVEKLTGKALIDHLEFAEIRGFRGVKEAIIDAGSTKVSVAVVSGLHNVEPIIKKIIQGVAVGYDLIEVMACPGGCICGAGHPVPEKIGELTQRQQVLVNIDKTSVYRKSQENPDILRLYDDFYGEANSPLAHALLHTHYRPKRSAAVNNRSRTKKDNSVFATREFTICTCEACSDKGAKELYNDMLERIKQSKMEAFINITTIRLKNTHAGKDIYITLDGKPVKNPTLAKLFERINAIK
jgi:formate dehydrogenase major subunit